MAAFDWLASQVEFHWGYTRPWTFGGGDGGVDPLIADEVGPLELIE